jgi:cyanate permease
LEGLRFDVVIGLYTIAMNFMEVMQDLLTIQLEHQESQSQSLAMLYGSTPQLSMITSSPMSDIETDNSGTSTPKSIPSIQPLGHDWGHSGRASIVRNKSCNKQPGK